jgi:hypothetical protein
MKASGLTVFLARVDAAEYGIIVIPLAGMIVASGVVLVRLSLRVAFISDVYFPRVNGVSTSIRTFPSGSLQLQCRVDLHHYVPVMPRRIGKALARAFARETEFSDAVVHVLHERHCVIHSRSRAAYTPRPGHPRSWLAGCQTFTKPYGSSQARCAPRRNVSVSRGRHRSRRGSSALHFLPKPGKYTGLEREKWGRNAH